MSFHAVLAAVAILGLVAAFAAILLNRHDRNRGGAGW